MRGRIDKEHRAQSKKFKKNPRYPHKRSEGATHRKNAGSRLQGKPFCGADDGFESQAGEGL